MSDTLNCCHRQQHDLLETAEGPVWRCSNCGAWWWSAEYGELVAAEMRELVREGDYFYFGRKGDLPPAA